MSSASWQKRKCHAQSERSNLLRKVEKFSQSDVTLTDEQHDEMCAIVEGIRTEELEKIFLEGSEHGVGDLMREIWYTDSKRQEQQFLHDQSKNGKLCNNVELILLFLYVYQFLELEVIDGA